MFIYYLTAFSYFHATTAELNSHDGDQMAYNTWNICCLALYFFLHLLQGR